MKFKPEQILMAAIPVVAGIVILNNLSKLAGSTIVGKIISGDLVRRA
jgi:hypothetical protein